MKKLTISLVALVAVLAVTFGALYGTSVFAHGAKMSLIVVATDTDDTEFGTGGGDSIKINVKGDDWEDLTGTITCHDKDDKLNLSAAVVDSSFSVSTIELTADAGGPIFIELNLDGPQGELSVAWIGENPCDAAGDTDIALIKSGDPGDDIKVTIDKN